MQLKNSLFLLTALTAGSTVARMHGHERRHAHHHLQHEEKRAVGDIVYANFNGVWKSWINEFSGVASTTSASDSTPTASSSGTSVVTVSAVPTASSGPTVTTPGSCKEWHAFQDGDNYTREGFGNKTANNGAEYIKYIGNVGDPYGSNIIEVSESKACEYKHVIRIDGSEKETWTVAFWNKMGPDLKLTGWYGNAVLTLKINPGESKYVAFDDDSQGAWGAAKGDSLPKDQYGGYACTWGEFDFGNTSNEGWSGWDVSAIQAQNAGLDVQGMRICTHDNQKCSAISNLAKLVENAYTALEAGVDGIGGEWTAGALRLVVNIDFD
ncbi:hypothetical protein BDV38DRAFT_261060 [Aspergillus pseudotamarii]|uniref:Allergen Asp f 4 n=1 Tax=Aspergillus pseudotamarii TaxID=132259 RepID=A0A5N6SFI7_ASPPS|nr:uncharacterized protein BDV38DRAFT_261060 [Aspergillus pseudotamarii]KAE8132470.1 hypothetical protein BDV38DRAFT_261060 [Aspergillus pseudotamarii]